MTTMSPGGQRANPGGRFTTPLETIAKMAGVSYETTFRAMCLLMAIGILQADEDGNGGVSTGYGRATAQAG